MTEHRSHKVRIANIPKDDALCVIGTKSLNIIVTAWIFVAVMLFSDYKLMTLPFLFVALLLTFRSGKKQFRGTKNYFIIYSSADPENCDLIYLSEVIGWEYRVKKYTDDYMCIILQDNALIKISEGVNIQMYRYFQRQLPALEIRLKKDKA